VARVNHEMIVERIARMKMVSKRVRSVQRPVRGLWRAPSLPGGRRLARGCGDGNCEGGEVGEGIPKTRTL